MKFKTETSSGGIVFKVLKSKVSKSSVVWLITQHSQHKGWVFPKGLVGDNVENESMESAALREVEEEGGVKAKIISNKPIITNYQYTWKGNLIKKTVYYYLMEYISGDPKNHDWEMSDAKFVSENEVKKILTYNSDQEAFAQILQVKI